MIGLERGEGEYFRDERYVQVPGIDNLDQLVPSAVHRADGTWTPITTSQLASSAAHLFGKPKAWVGRRRRLGRRWQVPDELPVGARDQRASGTALGYAPVVARGTGQATHPPPDTPNNLVCQSGRLSDGDWPFRGAGRPTGRAIPIWLGGQDATDATTA